MHLGRTAICHPTPRVDTHASKISAAGDKASTDIQRVPPKKPATPTAELREDHVDLQKYLTFLATQGDQMESYAKKGNPDWGTTKDGFGRRAERDGTSFLVASFLPHEQLEKEHNDICSSY
jgi:hypothetical protein